MKTVIYKIVCTFLLNNFANVCNYDCVAKTGKM